MRQERKSWHMLPNWRRGTDTPRSLTPRDAETPLTLHQYPVATRSSRGSGALRRPSAFVPIQCSHIYGRYRSGTVDLCCRIGRVVLESACIMSERSSRDPSQTRVRFARSYGRAFPDGPEPSVGEAHRRRASSTDHLPVPHPRSRAGPYALHAVPPRTQGAR